MLKIYALQVKNRAESKYIKLFRLSNPEAPFTLYAPLRQLNIRRRGIIRPSVQAVFPGYVFVETASEDGDEADCFPMNQWAFRRTAGFHRFLRSNQNICPLAGRDLELVMHFIKKAGPVAGLSKVYFDENSRIVVTDGPLFGLEGKIIKVDKRKGRAKIKLDLYDESFAIDLPFEVIGRA